MNFRLFSVLSLASVLVLAVPSRAQVVASEFAPTFPPQSPDISYGLAQNVTTNALIAENAPATYLVPVDASLGNTWSLPSFDDSTWTSGSTGIGYQTSLPGFAVHNYIA